MGWGGWPPPIFGRTKASAFSTSPQSRLASIVFDGVLRPPQLVGTPDDVLVSL